MMRTWGTIYLMAAVTGLAALLAGLGCGRDGAEAQRVVVYTSVDQPIAEPIVREFEKQTGITVDLQTDTEATKSAGLAARLEAEKSNPQADVWWSNEVFHTITLADSGTLTAYDPPAAADIPSKYKDPGHLWCGQTLRARMIAVTRVPEAAGKLPKITGLADLTNPALKNHVALARPTAGTTGGHVAALYVLWGDERANRYFQDLHDNGVKLLGGNSVVADSVGQGTVWAGLTDNDDADAAIKEGGKLDAFPADQEGPDAKGTLVIPCSVALVSGARHPDAAKKLIDFLLSKQVEQKLLEAKFAKYPVRGDATSGVKMLEVDYRAVSKVLPRAVKAATDLMEGRAPARDSAFGPG